MNYALEATVDICFRIGHFRNLTDRYLRSLFLHVSVSAGDLQASPYLIISDNQNPSSITLFEYVSPLYSFSPNAKAELSELAVFRLNIPIQDLETSPLSCKFTLFQQQFGGPRRDNNQPYHFALGQQLLSSFLQGLWMRNRPDRSDPNAKVPHEINQPGPKHMPKQGSRNPPGQLQQAKAQSQHLVCN